jgi:K+ transporter
MPEEGLAAWLSGAFSVARQGFLPRLTIRHASHQEIGQVARGEIETFLKQWQADEVLA